MRRVAGLAEDAGVCEGAAVLYILAASLADGSESALADLCALHARRIVARAREQGERPQTEGRQDAINV